MGNYSCTTAAIPMKLYVPNYAMEIHICFKFSQMQVSSYLVMLILLISSQLKGNNSCITVGNLATLYMHQGLIAIHTYFKFYEFPVRSYLVIAHVNDLCRFKGNNCYIYYSDTYFSFKKFRLTVT